MHGIIHKSLKEYVTERMADGAWDTVVERAGIDPKLYLPVSYYPDEEVTDILEVLASLSGHSEDAIQRDFGRFLAPSLLDTFKAHVRDSWGTIDTVTALDVIYEQLEAKNDDGPQVEIDTERQGDDTVVVTYRSDRHLSAIAEGVVHGIADHYDESVAVDVQDQHTEDGDEVRTFTVVRQ